LGKQASYHKQQQQQQEQQQEQETSAVASLGSARTKKVVGIH